jgi:hypothetical protein
MLQIIHCGSINLYIKSEVIPQYILVHRNVFQLKVVSVSYICIFFYTGLNSYITVATSAIM